MRQLRRIQICSSVHWNSRLRLRRNLRVAILAACGITATKPSFADEGASNTQALAKQAQNPIANLISVPIQSNTYFDVGRENGVEEALYFQPVVPFTLNAEWNLITRWIVPLIDVPQLTPGGQGNTFGVGDINPSAFLSHVSGDLIWGVGPTFVLPTASDHALGQGRWSAGPTAVILYTPGKWVEGLLVNNVWSFASAEHNRAKVNQTVIQPFVNYNIEKGWYLTSSPILTSNWRAGSRDRWTIPIGGGVGRLIKFDGVPLNSYVQVFSNVVRPDGGPSWSIRLQIQVLLPK